MRMKLLFPFIVILAAKVLIGCSIPVTSPSGWPITKPVITGVTVPVLGAIPVATINETDQYTGTVVWSGSPVTFVASTVYTATITLTAKENFKFSGVATDFFTVAGAISDTNAVDSGIVTAVFPVTVAIVSGNIGNIMEVTGGTFNNGEADMTVSSFRMSQHEITGEQYASVMGITDPSYFANVINNPVERVTWYDSVEFCNKLSTFEGLTPVYTVTSRTPTNGYPISSATVTANWSASGYRLPTEAEWEFAARGGNATNNYIFAGSNNIDDVAWYFNNSGYTTHPVGDKTANELGLKDMSGNVFEWCWDMYWAYPNIAQTDYRGNITGHGRVKRGGDWSNFSTYSLVGNRSYGYPDACSTLIGFRVVRL